MKTIESFPHLIDNIVGELEKASRIRIDCMAAGEPELLKNVSAIRVAAVNGMDTSWRYHNRIRHLKAEAITKFRELIPQIAPGDLDTFTGMARRRVRRMAHSVMPVGFATSAGSHSQKVQWSPRQLNCFLGDAECAEPHVIWEAVTQTRRQAWLYYVELNRLEERINSFAGTIVSTPHNIPAGLAGKQTDKIMLNCTVAFFAAMMRIMCDRNLIDHPNMSDLCRRVSGTFCTSRQKNLSAHSIRNHFDNPSPEILEQLQNEFRICENYTNRLILVQRV